MCVEPTTECIIKLYNSQRVSSALGVRHRVVGDSTPWGAEVGVLHSQRGRTQAAKATLSQLPHPSPHCSLNMRTRHKFSFSIRIFCGQQIAILIININKTIIKKLKGISKLSFLGSQNCYSLMKNVTAVHTFHILQSSYRYFL